MLQVTIIAISTLAI